MRLTVLLSAPHWRAPYQEHMSMDGPMELSLALIPPFNGLHDAPPTTKGISTSWAGAVGSFLLCVLFSR